MSTQDELLAEVEATARIDYLKFIFKTDAEEWQERYWPVLGRINAWLEGAGHKPCKCTPLGEGPDGLRRYVVEYVGSNAHHAAAMVPDHWYNCMYRIDYREEVEPMDTADIKAVQAYVAVRPSGRTSTSTFTTRPATKTHQRDVGGVGVRIGSRKSDQHGVLYKRGNERAAFEFRLQGRAAVEWGRALFGDVSIQTATQMRAVLVGGMRKRSREFLLETMGVANPDHLMEKADQARAYMPSMFDAGNDEEKERADAWWESMNETSQVEYQKARWDTTPKARKE